MSTAITLISFDLCPYVQRAAIVLAEKGVPFRRVDIDLAAKPDWFLALSPTGRVPVLQVDGEVLFESAAIIEYLDEVHAPRMHPADPLARARHRAWIDVGSSVLQDIWTLETTGDSTAFEAAGRSIHTRLSRIEPLLGNGPWFGGQSFSLVDAVFAPVFRYFDSFDRALPGLFDGLAGVSGWRARLASRPSVRNSVVADYGERLCTFVRQQGGILAARLA